jgi:hypothetical protein
LMPCSLASTLWVITLWVCVCIWRKEGMLRVVNLLLVNSYCIKWEKY